MVRVLSGFGVNFKYPSRNKHVKLVNIKDYEIYEIYVKSSKDKGYFQVYRTDLWEIEHCKHLPLYHIHNTFHFFIFIMRMKYIVLLINCTNVF